MEKRQGKYSRIFWLVLSGLIPWSFDLHKCFADPFPRWHGKKAPGDGRGRFASAMSEGWRVLGMIFPSPSLACGVLWGISRLLLFLYPNGGKQWGYLWSKLSQAFYQASCPVLASINAQAFMAASGGITASGVGEMQFSLFSRLSTLWDWWFILWPQIPRV